MSLVKRSTKAPPATPVDDFVLATIHRTGKVWRGVLATTRGVKPAVLATRDFPVDRVERFDEWLDEHQAASVLCVLPAGSVICRNISLPNAPPEQLAMALRLQAEAHLMGIAPPHRLCMAVLPNAPGETTRTGIILAWPDSAQFEAPFTTRPVSYVPDVACLAAIMNGLRPTEPQLWLDRGMGTVAIALTHTGGAIFRGTSEDAQEADAWQRSIARIVAETALNVSHTASFVDSIAQDAQRKAASIGPSEAALFVNHELIRSAAEQMDGVSAEPLWWSRYGIAAGAILARTGHLASLTQLQRTPPVEVPSRIKVVLDALSHPKAATFTVLACAVVLMFGPVVSSAVRLGILKLRYSDVEAQLKAARDAENKLAIYQELQRQKAWPMAKLLADITTNTPMGIDVERITLENGNFSLNGTVNAYESDGRRLSPQEVFTLMQDNLRKDGIFGDLVSQWKEPSNFGIYKFELSGKVNKPYRQGKYEIERDFGAWTFAMRRDGEPPKGAAPAKAPEPTELAGGHAREASGPLADAGSTASPASTGNLAHSRPGSRGSIADSTVGASTAETGDGELPNEGVAASASGRSSRGPRFGSDSSRSSGDDNIMTFDDRGSDGGVDRQRDIPEPLTPEQISAMSQPELQQALQRVANARKYYKDTSSEPGARLRKEMDMIIAQLKKAKATT